MNTVIVYTFIYKLKQSQTGDATGLFPFLSIGFTITANCILHCTPTFSPTMPHLGNISFLKWSSIMLVNSRILQHKHLCISMSPIIFTDTTVARKLRRWHSMFTLLPRCIKRWNVIRSSSDQIRLLPTLEQLNSLRRNSNVKMFMCINKYTYNFICFVLFFCKFMYFNQ